MTKDRVCICKLSKYQKHANLVNSLGILDTSTRFLNICSRYIYISSSRWIKDNSMIYIFKLRLMGDYIISYYSNPQKGEKDKYITNQSLIAKAMGFLMGEM